MIAGDGRQAVERVVESAGSFDGDAVLMDLQMPEGGGLEATRRLTAADPQIYILVVTLFEDDDSVFAALRAGADADTLAGVAGGPAFVEALGTFLDKYGMRGPNYTVATACASATNAIGDALKTPTEGDVIDEIYPRLPRTSVDFGIPLITNLQIAQRLTQALTHIPMEELKVRSWNKYK